MTLRGCGCCAGRICEGRPDGNQCASGCAAGNEGPGATTCGAEGFATGGIALCVSGTAAGAEGCGLVFEVENEGGFLAVSESVPAPPCAQRSSVLCARRWTNHVVPVLLATESPEVTRRVSGHPQTEPLAATRVASVRPHCH